MEKSRDARGRAKMKPAALGLALVLCSYLVTGCAERHAQVRPAGSALPEVKPSPPVPAAPVKPPDVADDPRGYLKHVLEKCATLEQYTVTFTREERRGLFNFMQPPERIACWFRRQPFSIRMKWLDPDVKYGESTYVAGQDGNRVRFVPRFGLLGLPPSVTRVDLQTPVIWGEARYPLTEFGLERMMRRTFKAMADVGDRVRIEYLGRSAPARLPGAFHHLRVTYPHSAERIEICDLYFDPATDLPVATVLTQDDGRIEGVYAYAELNPRVALTDEDFLMEFERAARSNVVQAAQPR